MEPLDITERPRHGGEARTPRKESSKMSEPRLRKNDGEALSLALYLAITAPDEVYEMMAVTLAEGIACGMSQAEVAIAKEKALAMAGKGIAEPTLPTFATAKCECPLCCSSCGRPELVCSKAPCDDVIRERES